jgi:HlyD family type I secretion membrane fusion protein
MSNISNKKYSLYGLSALLILIAGFGYWAFETTIDGAVVASGQIEAESKRRVIQHSSGGKIERINIREGDVVISGQLLLKLDDSQLQSDLSIVENRVFEVLARRARFESERDGNSIIEFDPELEEVKKGNNSVIDLMLGQKRLFSARLKSMTDSKEQIENQKAQIRLKIKGYLAQKQSVRDQIKIAEEQLKTQSDLLEKGLTQKGPVLSIKANLASLNGTLGEILANEATSNERIIELDLKSIQFESTRREEAITRLRDLKNSENDLYFQRKSLLSQIDDMYVYSPTSGVVYDLGFTSISSVIRSGEPILNLVPVDEDLLVAARVSPEDVEQVFVGQRVTIRFISISDADTPELEGKVSHVSADVFSSENGDKTFYKVNIKITGPKNDFIKSLIPGIPVDVFILTENRTPMSFLIKPLSDYFSKAFR